MNIFHDTLQGYWITPGLRGACLAVIMGAWRGIKLLRFRAAGAITLST